MLTTRMTSVLYIAETERNVVIFVNQVSQLHDCPRCTIAQCSVLLAVT